MSLIFSFFFNLNDFIMVIVSREVKAIQFPLLCHFLSVYALKLMAKVFHLIQVSFDSIQSRELLGPLFISHTCAYDPRFVGKGFIFGNKATNLSPLFFNFDCYMKCLIIALFSDQILVWTYLGLNEFAELALVLEV